MTDISVISANDRLVRFREEGLDWIGSLPESWDVVKLKYLVNISKAKSSDYDTFIGLEDVESWTGRYIPSTHIDVDDPEDEDSEEDSRVTKGDDSGEDDEEQKELLEVKEGDVLFSKLRPYLAKCMISPIDAACSSEFLVFRDFKGDKRFLKYVMLSSNFINMVNSSTYGTKMPRSNWDFIKNLPFPKISYESQNLISDYLDNLYTSAEFVISNYSMLVERLVKYRDSIIIKCITKGVNSNVELKDAHIEWIDNIPQNWTVVKLNEISSICRGTIDKKVITGELPVKLIQYTNVYNRRVQSLKYNDYLDITVLPCELNECSLKKGDLLVTASSETIGDIGHSTVIMEDMPNHVFGADVIRVRFHDGVMHPAYEKYLLENSLYLSKMSMYSRGVTRFRFSMSSFSSLEIPLPPIDEQVIISRFLDSFCNNIDCYILKIQTIISSICEWRNSVCSHIVSGK